MVLGPPALIEALGPLVDLRRRQGPVRIVAGAAADLSQVLAGLDSDARILLLEDPTQPSCRAQYTRPLHDAPHGTAVIGWLRADLLALKAHAALACGLAGRRRNPDTPQPLVLLGPRERRYQALMDTVEARAKGRLACFRWTAERIRPGSLASALRSGLGAALYAGHGAPDGWLAYGGLAARDLAPTAAAPDNAIAAIFSLACHTAAVRGHIGFADTVVASGVAGAVLAPIAEVRHEATRAIAPAIADALAVEPSSLCEVLRLLSVSGLSLDGYTVVGDPAATVVSTHDALQACRSIFAPAPDASLSTDASWGVQSPIEQTYA